jgi:putative Mn2+ efflux pump MntP
MSLVLMVLSLALALAREGMVRRLRSLLRHVDRVAGALLVVVGAYLVYYGFYALDDSRSASSPVGWVERLSVEATVRLDEGGVGLGAAFAVLVVAAVAWSLLARRRAAAQGPRRSTNHPSPSRR